MSTDGDDMPMLYQCEKCLKEFGRPEEQYACEREHARAKSSTAEYVLPQAPNKEPVPERRVVEKISLAEVNTLSLLRMEKNASSAIDVDAAVRLQSCTHRSAGAFK